MWKIMSRVATVLSFISAFYLWVKVRKKIEEDPFYYYGDSMYRSDLNEEQTVEPPTMDDLDKQSESTVFQKDSSMVH